MEYQSPLLELPGSNDPIPQVGFGLWKVKPESAADTVYEVSHIRLPILTKRR
jgi:diketogulonate reductase-like aldo/keto reductase